MGKFTLGKFHIGYARAAALVVATFAVGFFLFNTAAPIPTYSVDSFSAKVSQISIASLHSIGAAFADDGAGAGTGTGGGDGGTGGAASGDGNTGSTDGAGAGTGTGGGDGCCAGDPSPASGDTSTTPTEPTPQDTTSYGGTIDTPVTDVCPNLAGVQATVPAGNVLVDGNCVFPLNAPTLTTQCAADGKSATLSWGSVGISDAVFAIRYSGSLGCPRGVAVVRGPTWFRSIRFRWCSV